MPSCLKIQLGVPQENLVAFLRRHLHYSSLQNALNAGCILCLFLERCSMLHKKDLRFIRADWEHIHCKDPKQPGGQGTHLQKGDSFILLPVTVLNLHAQNTSNQPVVKAYSSDRGDVSFKPLERQHSLSSTCPVSALTILLLNTSTEGTIFYRRETHFTNPDQTQWQFFMIFKNTYICYLQLIVVKGKIFFYFSIHIIDFFFQERIHGRVRGRNHSGN